MQWYYAHGGQQIGPLTDEDFRDKVQTGIVGVDTLVWHDGLTDWQTYGKLTGKLAPATLTRRTVCSQCMREFPQDDLIQYQNIWICASCKPAFFQRLKEGISPVGASVWRDGKSLVMGRGAELPDRCVKCNAPAHGFRLTKKLSWHPPAYYLLICLGALVYVIAALIVRKQATILIGLCPTHVQKRKTAIGITLGVLGIAALSFIAAIAGEYEPLFGITTLAILAAMIYGVITLPIVKARKIDERFVWVNGVDPSYLSELPSFTPV